MNPKPMMMCGHAANAITSNDLPCCVICAPDPKSMKVSEYAPNLEGRMARCSCKKLESSSTTLAFFEFRGDGSDQALRSCKHCGVYIEALRLDGPKQCVGHEFESHGAYEFDAYYCGHAGWD
jgi:hypothetical protein